MTRWQIATIGTMTVAATLAALSVLAALLIFLHDPSYAYASALFKPKNPDADGARLFLALVTLTAGCAAAGSLVSLQQWFAQRAADRELSRLRKTYASIDAAHGREAAHAWIGGRLPEIETGEKVDLFGTRGVAN